MNNINYSISDFKLDGDNQINKILRKNFNRFKEKNSINPTKDYKIETKSLVIKTTNSKDQSGDNTNLSIKITVEVKIINNEKVLKELNLSEDINYNNIENKFELKQYEKILINDLTIKILEKIHLNLSIIK